MMEYDDCKDYDITDQDTIKATLRQLMKTNDEKIKKFTYLPYSVSPFYRDSVGTEELNQCSSNS